MSKATKLLSRRRQSVLFFSDLRCFAMFEKLAGISEFERKLGRSVHFVYHTPATPPLAKFLEHWNPVGIISDSVRYNVMVRKQCHYATSNYDTTVYSEWLSYLSFGTTILDTVWRTVDANSANPDMGTVIGGGMYMDSSVVTLTARSLGNSEFDIWNDGDTTNPRQIFVISDTSFTAFFREKES